MNITIITTVKLIELMYFTLQKQPSEFTIRWWFLYFSPLYWLYFLQCLITFSPGNLVFLIANGGNYDLATVWYQECKILRGLDYNIFASFFILAIKSNNHSSKLTSYILLKIFSQSIFSHLLNTSFTLS